MRPHDCTHALPEASKRVDALKSKLERWGVGEHDPSLLSMPNRSRRTGARSSDCHIGHYRQVIRCPARTSVDEACTHGALWPAENPVEPEQRIP
jgi:hypothetical protein